MPNVKIFVDETLMPACRERLIAAMEPLRAILCTDLEVDVPAFQFAIVPVIAMPDLPRVNVEMHVLPHPHRTRDRLLSVAADVQARIAAAAGTHTAVRITTLPPEGYVALK